MRMKARRFFNGWVFSALLLVIIIIAGIIFIWVKTGSSHVVEIILVPERQATGQIYVGGEVNNPGWYPVFSNDNIQDIIGAAGGLKDGADINSIELTVGSSPEGAAFQKININRADAWLLEALPGVGEVKAQAIVEYRSTNGIFHDINELARVLGFSENTVENLKDLITVND
jgi:competence protein ComEA